MTPTHDRHRLHVRPTTGGRWKLHGEYASLGEAFTAGRLLPDTPQMWLEAVRETERESEQNLFSDPSEWSSCEMPQKVIPTGNRAGTPTTDRYTPTN